MPWSFGWFCWFWELILLCFFGVTKLASGRGVSLSLWLCFIAKIQAGGTLDSAVTGTWRFCIRCLSALPSSVDTRQDPREPLLVDFVISLPAILWRLVTVFLMMGLFSLIDVGSGFTAYIVFLFFSFLMMGCWHPERM